MADGGGLGALLAIGFGLGLVHALDADHVMAVSALAGRGRSWRTSVSLAARWSLGHALSLGVLALAVLAVGWSLPAGWAPTSERLVGAVMIGLGLWVVLDLRRQRVHAHFHEHDDLPTHAHWHHHDHEEADGPTHRAAHRRGHRHAPTLVGILHGAAGSAGLLGVVPAVAGGSVGLGLAYLSAFAVGVLVAMSVFGGLLGVVFERAERSGATWPVLSLRLASGLGAFGVGVFWLTAGGLG